MRHVTNNSQLRQARVNTCTCVCEGIVKPGACKCTYMYTYVTHIYKRTYCAYHFTNLPHHSNLLDKRRQGIVGSYSTNCVTIKRPSRIKIGTWLLLKPIMSGSSLVIIWLCCSRLLKWLLVWQLTKIKLKCWDVTLLEFQERERDCRYEFLDSCHTDVQCTYSTVKAGTILLTPCSLHFFRVTPWRLT